jgi:hypothetical protein
MSLVSIAGPRFSTHIGAAARGPAKILRESLTQ